MKKPLYNYYQKLLREYGDPVNYWPQWCAQKKSEVEREKIIIGMILVQRTSWHNANIALKNLKRNKLLSTEKISVIKNVNKLAKIIKSAGFHQTKPKTLINVCTYIVNQGSINKLMDKEIEKIRKEFINIKGIGPETAATILLYALDKPVFIIDEYTRRWVKKHNLTSERDYEKLQNFFYQNLKTNLEIYQKFHALIIICQRGREKSRMEIV